MFADVTLQHFARQFTVGWYASRVSILFAASAVLWVLLSQTATIYAQLAVTAERLRNESLTDVLTGLPNRRSFDQRFAEMLRDCAREGGPLALLMIDVDHFKAYNDTFGHQRGDDCLRAIGALLLSNAARARDLVARIGGEEIAVIMPRVDLAGAIVVAERMRATVQSAAITQGSGAQHPVVTISVGITATSDPAGTTVEELVRTADRALYRAKDTGRNRVIELSAPLVLAGLPNA
jgi:diguanylate cyclase (GGDEF)-like protein